MSSPSFRIQALRKTSSSCLYSVAPASFLLPTLSSDTMRNRDRWDVVYADCFKNQPEGHALYKKLSITQLKPGTCGYFDDQGDWQQIEDLTVVNQQQTTKGTNAAEQRTESFTSVLGIRRIDDPEGEKWFLRKSENVHRLSAEALTKVSYVSIL